MEIGAGAASENTKYSSSPLVAALSEYIAEKFGEEYVKEQDNGVKDQNGRD